MLLINQKQNSFEGSLELLPNKQGKATTSIDSTMAVLAQILPKAISSVNTDYDHSKEPWFINRYSLVEAEVSKTCNPVPPYSKRFAFKPSKPENFVDGGVFPEIHYAQYPLGMGRRNTNVKLGAKSLPLTVDERGNIRYDVIVKQDENAKKIVYSRHSDLVPIFIKDGEKEKEMEVDEKQKEIEETALETKAALEKIVNVRLSASQPKSVPTQCSDYKLIKYKPSQQSAAFNSGAKERIIRMVEMPVDPLEPPKFKHKKVPKASGSPPVPVLHSPPRPVTVKDKKDWNIPPCISDWKNGKGYTIPLDKRLAADGRGLQDVKISDNFAKLAEALIAVEQKAREGLNMRNKVLAEMERETEKKNIELRELAKKAILERRGAYDGEMRGPQTETREEREGRLQRDETREERRKEKERERRLEAKDAAMGKKSKISRDKGRDISEKVALGMASTGLGGGEVMYDQRLLNQAQGMQSGFAADDTYAVYDKRLFTAQSTMSTLYKPKRDRDDEVYSNADEQLHKLRKTERFKPDRAFVGTSEGGRTRNGPVEFENNQQPPGDDIFGLNQFMIEVKTGKKAMDKVGSGGTLRACAGSMRDGFEGSGRSRINFEKGC